MSFDYLLFILTIKRSKNNGHLKAVGITQKLALIYKKYRIKK